MKEKWKKAAWVVLTLAIVAVGSIVFLRAREPVYEGKPLAAWLEAWDKSLRRQGPGTPFPVAEVAQIQVGATMKRQVRPICFKAIIRRWPYWLVVPFGVWFLQTGVGLPGPIADVPAKSAAPAILQTVHNVPHDADERIEKLARERLTKVVSEAAVRSAEEPKE